MKNCVFWLILSLFIGFSFTYSQDFKEWTQNEAPPLFLKMQSQTQNKNFKVNFESTLKKEGLNKDLKSSGTLWFCEDDRLIWEQKSDSKTVSEKTLIHKNKSFKLDSTQKWILQKSPTSVQHMSQIIQGLKEGKLNALQNHFKLYWFEKGASWTFKFEAKGMASRYLQRIELFGDTQLDSILVWQKDGSSKLQFKSPLFISLSDFEKQL